jgi:hypothetical protein
LTALTFFLLAILSPGVASAHGNLDQSLAGDPGCNTTNFDASVTGASGQRQSFKPTGSALSSVAICVSAPADTPIVVAIYGGAGVLGGGSSASNPAGSEYANPSVKWVHVDFISPLPVTPGQTYIIENQTGSTVTWYGTTSASPYTYCHGEPNTAAVVDYGFHAFVADAPAASPPCPDPTPTNTTVPLPTSTPQPPTTTPAPGETVAPAASTPVPGETIAAATGADSAPAGTLPADSGAPSGGSAAPSASAPATSGRTLPASGSGPAGEPGGTIFLAMLVGGLLLLGAGWTFRGSG